MDVQSSNQFKEALKAEMRMQIKFLTEMDLSDAQELPSSVQYKSSELFWYIFMIFSLQQYNNNIEFS